MVVDGPERDPAALCRSYNASSNGYAILFAGDGWPLYCSFRSWDLVLLQVEDVELPKASTVCWLVLISNFLVTAGIAYDIINEPPAIGATQDEVTGKSVLPSRLHAHARPLCICSMTTVFRAQLCYALNICAASGHCFCMSIAPATPDVKRTANTTLKAAGYCSTPFGVSPLSWAANHSNLECRSHVMHDHCSGKAQTVAGTMFCSVHRQGQTTAIHASSNERAVHNGGNHGRHDVFLRRCAAQDCSRVHSLDWCNGHSTKHMNRGVAISYRTNQQSLVNKAASMQHAYAQ